MLVRLDIVKLGQGMPKIVVLSLTLNIWSKAGCFWNWLKN